MAESRPLRQKDVDVIGWYPETTKGTLEIGTTYNTIQGVTQEVSYRVDDDRRSHWRSGDGDMASQQTRGQRKGSGKLHFKLAKDGITSGYMGTSFLALLLSDTSFNTVTTGETISAMGGRILTRGTQYIGFDAGATAFAAGEELTGTTSTATASIKEVILTGGAWDGSATGYLVLTNIVPDNTLGTFQNNEALTDSGTGAGVADGANLTIGADLNSFSLWIRQKNYESDATLNHALSGCMAQKITISGLENGDVEIEVDFKFMDRVLTAPGTSSLPSEPYTVGMPFFEYTSSDGALTLKRAGTNQRIKSFNIVFDNGDLHEVPLTGQRSMINFAPGKLMITGSIDFLKQDTEIATIWNTDPNNTKTLTYTGSNLNVGAIVMDQNTGATATVVTAASPSTIKNISGQFNSGDVCVDTTSPSTDRTLSADMTDTSTLDFQIVLSKNSAAEYLKIALYNVYPTGSDEFTHNPQEDALWMDSYPFEVFKNGNVVIDIA